MLPPPRAISLTVISLIICNTGVVSGQAYPNKPVRIVTAGVGSAGDIAARLVAQGLAGGLGQQVVVDNRSSGVIPVEVVARAAADGYTLLLYGNVIWLSPYLQDNVSYDPVQDLSPITLVATSPNILAVHPSLPAKSVKELIMLAKARPGELNYSSGGAGSSSHLAGELFKSMAGVNIIRVEYKAGGVALSDLIGGQVQMTFAPVSGVAPHAKTGRLRALAVTGLEPSALAPGLPTVAAAGLPGYESVSIIGLFAPGKAPAAVVERLNRESVRTIQSPEVKEKFLNAGVEVVGSSPEALAIKMKSVIAAIAKLIKDTGIKAE